jgi:chemotaxis protein MotB|tara:strand:+ start:274 stop:1209 length:936 start_codon:yes stop_codon:yes gene_type:complete
MKPKNILALMICVLTMQSCVSLKKFKDLDSDFYQLTNAKDSLSYLNHDLELINSELNDNVFRLSLRSSALENDTILLGKEFRRKYRAYEDLNSSYEVLMRNNSTTMAKQAKENKELMERLGQMEVDLQERELAIKSREQDVESLNNLLKQKDAHLSTLKSSVAKALLGFKGEGLTVEQRNGKLYVSLENSLLFASGSWRVNANGAHAITELSKVIANQVDLQILVEGHTDNIPYKGSGLVKDNWDLSVMRATSIVKILTNNKGLNALNITAAGKGPFSPLVENNSPENRAMNRRIEIILSPNMDALMNLLE